MAAVVTKESHGLRDERGQAFVLVVASLVGSLLIMVSQVSDRAPPTPWEDGSTVLSGICGGGRRAGACSPSLDPFRSV